MIANTHITTYFCQEKFSKVAEYSYHYVRMPEKVFQRCRLLLSLSVRAKKSVEKLWIAHITNCSCQVKCSKVAEYL